MICFSFFLFIQLFILHPSCSFPSVPTAITLLLIQPPPLSSSPKKGQVSHEYQQNMPYQAAGRLSNSPCIILAFHYLTLFPQCYLYLGSEQSYRGYPVYSVVFYTTSCTNVWAACYHSLSFRNRNVSKVARYSSFWETLIKNAFYTLNPLCQNMGEIISERETNFKRWTGKAFTNNNKTVVGSFPNNLLSFSNHKGLYVFVFIPINWGRCIVSFITWTLA